MTSDLDWVWYTVSGLLVLLAVSLLYRALLRDRVPAGKRRCPKCWYDMSGTQSWTCSECGFATRKERELRKTRRHRRLVIAAILVLALAYVSVRVPRLNERGWWGFAPTTALIAMMPKLETQFPSAFNELESRMNSGSLARWQWHWLIGRCAPEGALWTFDVHTRSRWPESQPLGCHFHFWQHPTGRKYFDTSTLRISIRAVGQPDENPLIITEANSVRLPVNCLDPPPMISLPGQWEAGVTTAEFDVSFERPASLSGAAAPGWTSVGRQRISVPVIFVKDHDDAVARLTDPELTRQIADRVRFELLPGGLELWQRYGYRWPTTTACAVRIELLRDGELQGSWQDRWEFVSAQNAERWKRFAAAKPWPDAESLAVGTWQIRVIGTTDRVLWATCADAYWADEILIPLQPAERDGVMILTSAYRE